MSDPILTPCYCPDTPHEHDEFVLVDELPLAAGLAAAQATGLEGIVPALLRNGAIASWNLVDDKGRKVPITPQTIDKRLTWSKSVEFLAEALPRLIELANPGEPANPGPLVSASSAKRNGKPSRGGRTARLTSVKTPSSPEPPEPSA